MNKVWRAGVIPYHVRNGNVKMLFMIPSDTTYGGSDPQIAKGKEDPEDHGNFQSTALREGKEELGLRENNMVTFEELGLFMTRTHIFITEVRDMYNFDEPHYETQSIQWLTIDEFLEKGRELHKPVVFAAYNRILELENG